MNTPIVWAGRVAWAALAFTQAPAIGQALEGRTRSVQVTGTVGAWIVWSVGLLATLVPTTVSLTVLRALAPGAAVVGVIAWVDGASSTVGAVAVATGGVAAALAFSGDLGQAFVQGSAYGDERRLLLRPPGPLMLVLPVAWVVVASAVLIGPLALAARQWILGGGLVAVAAATTVPVGRRFHRLSRRWLVVVPAGVVIHDHVVLAETTMIPRVDVVGAGLALEGTGAANLTGLAVGPVVELQLREPVTFVLAAPPRGSTRAIHATAVLISPTRPGRALRALPISRSGNDPV